MSKNKDKARKKIEPIKTNEDYEPGDFLERLRSRRKKKEDEKRSSRYNRFVKNSSGYVILYHISRRDKHNKKFRPPKPSGPAFNAYERSGVQDSSTGGEAGDAGWDRPVQFKDTKYEGQTIGSGVFLTINPAAVAMNHGIWGNVYAYAVPRWIFNAAGGSNTYDGAPEILIPGDLWLLCNPRKYKKSNKPCHYNIDGVKRPGIVFMGLHMSSGRHPHNPDESAHKRERGDHRKSLMDSADEYRQPDNDGISLNRYLETRRESVDEDYTEERDLMLLMDTNYPEFSIKYMQEDRLKSLAMYIKKKYDADSLLSNAKKLSEIIGRDLKHVLRGLVRPDSGIIFRVKRLIGPSKYDRMSYEEKDVARWVSSRINVEKARVILVYVAVMESLKYE